MIQGITYGFMFRTTCWALSHPNGGHEWRFKIWPEWSTKGPSQKHWLPLASHVLFEVKLEICFGHLGAADEAVAFYNTNTLWNTNTLKVLFFHSPLTWLIILVIYCLWYDLKASPEVVLLWQQVNQTPMTIINLCDVIVLFFGLLPSWWQY